MTIISYAPAVSTSFPLSSPFSAQHSSLFYLPAAAAATTTTTSKPRSLIRAKSSAYTSPTGVLPPAYARNSPDQTLLTLLRQRKTEQAWLLYTQIESTHLPSSTCLSRLVSQLSYQNTQEGLTRAQSIITRLRNDDLLRRLDANSLGLLAVSAARAGHTQYAHAVIKSMLSYNYLPHVKAWSAVISRLAAAGDDGPLEAIKLFYVVMRRVRKVETAGDSRPDTAAFNAVLNACANLGDVRRFLKLFDEMPKWGVEPDVLTYNVLIKLCAKAGRKDLIVYVLELLLERGIEPCATTFHSLVAAYVGFRDLGTAEKLVQAMREGRKDVCKILKELKSEKRNDDSDSDEEEDEEDEEEYETEYDEVFKQLLPNWARTGDDSAVITQAPLLPKRYPPDSRIYSTLMKGYMKAGRVSDTVRTLEAMRHQKDVKSQPDHVSYTTVISAFVKAGSMDRARQVLAEMSRIGVPANVVTYNILLKGYCNQLQISKAKELMREMVKAGILPDVVSYNTMIDGCILGEDSSGALAYFNEMRARGLAPTKISYTTLMKAFALSGQPGLAQKVFDEMLKDPRVKVDQVAWNMLVDGYCKLGLIEAAKKVVEKMKEYGCHPNVSTYGSLANGIALSRKPGEALLLWNEVKERCKVKISKKDEEESGGDFYSNSSAPPPPPIIPDKELLETLADICVRAAFFRKALEIVACMEEHGIPPNKRKYSRIYVEMHSKMFTSKHASRARQDRRRERKRAAEAFKFWLGLPNSYYDTDWSL